MALDRGEMNDRVLDIAQTLLNEGGATNLKARTIAEKAGIAVGSIYNLFGDLDQVHGFVNMRLLDGLASAGNTAVRDLEEMGVSDTRLKLLSLSRSYLNFVQSHAASWAAMLAFNPRRMSPEHLAAYEQRLDALFEIIAKVFEDDPGTGDGRASLPGDGQGAVVERARHRHEQRRAASAKPSRRRRVGADRPACHHLHARGRAARACGGSIASIDLWAGRASRAAGVVKIRMHASSAFRHLAAAADYGLVTARLAHSVPQGRGRRRMSFLKKLFGIGNSAESAVGEPKAAGEAEHKGFTIRATPFKQDGQYQTCGVISKEIDGVVKEHKFIRADRFAGTG